MRLLALRLMFALPLLACGESTINAPVAPGAITALNATGLTGTAGLPLSTTVEFRVAGTDGQPLSGVTVTFAASGGGTVNPASATTDGQGRVSTSWTLSRSAGANALTASTAGNVATTVNATGNAGRAANVASTTPTTMSAAVGTPIATPPSVRVTDAFNNPVANVSVTFSLVSGGGTLTGPVARTTATGVATLGAWTLGSQVGTHVLVARVEETGVTNNPVVYTVATTAGAATTITATSATSQTGSVGANVAAPPRVVVTDAGGNPVPNVAVSFSVLAGGGVVTPTSIVTDAAGVAATTRWTLGNAIGANTVQASAPGVGVVTFNATAAAGPASAMVISAGDGQSTQAGKPVSIAPAVLVRDVQGNPVAGVVVTFVATAGGGVVIGSRQVTDASGIAEVGGWFLGSTPGVNALTANATGLQSVTFTATATAGAPAFFNIISGDQQAAIVGTAVASAPTVRVTDAVGNPVSGIAVTFTVASGGGSITGASTTTDAQGQAAVGSWVLGPSGTNTLTATVAGLGVLTFTAQSATSIAVTAAPTTGTLGVNFSITVQLRNSVGGVVGLAGVPLSITIASGGGTLAGQTLVVTDTGGSATFTLNLTGAAGGRTFQITGAGLAAALTGTITF